MPNDIMPNIDLYIPNNTLLTIKRERGTNKFIQSTTGQPKVMKECSLEYVYDIVGKMNKLQDKRELLFSAQKVAVSFAKGFCEVIIIGKKNIAPMRMTRTGLAQLLTEARSAWSVNELTRKIERQSKNPNGLKALSMSLSLDFEACLDKDLHFRTCLTRIGDKVERIVYGVTSTKYTPFDGKEMLECLHDAGFGQYSLQNFSISREGIITSFSQIPITEKELKVQVPCLRVGGGFVKNQAVWIAALLFRLWCTNGCGTTKTQREDRWTRSSSFDTISEGLKATATGKLTEAQEHVKLYNKAVDVLVGDMWSEFMGHVMTDGGVAQRTQDAVFRMMGHETVTKNASVATGVDVMTLAAQEQPQSAQLLLEQVSWQSLSLFDTPTKVKEYVEVKRTATAE